MSFCRKKSSEGSLSDKKLNERIVETLFHVGLRSRHPLAFWIGDRGPGDGRRVLDVLQPRIGRIAAVVLVPDHGFLAQLARLVHGGTDHFRRKSVVNLDRIYPLRDQAANLRAHLLDGPRVDDVVPIERIRNDAGCSARERPADAVPGHVHARSLDDPVPKHLALRDDPRGRIGRVGDRGDSVAEVHLGHPIPVVDVRFEQSGKDGSAVRLNHFGIRGIGDLSLRPDGPDAVPFHHDDCVLARRCSCSVNEGSALDDQRLLLCVSGNRDPKAEQEAGNDRPNPYLFSLVHSSLSSEPTARQRRCRPVFRKFSGQRFHQFAGARKPTEESPRPEAKFGSL